MSLSSQVRVPKAAELVASRLRSQIITGELSEGGALPSEALMMEQYGVSRPTLREAVRILESESLVEVRRGARGGARVKTPSVDMAARYAGYVLQFQGATMRDVFRARTLTEGPLGEMVVEAKARKETVGRLMAAVDEAEQHLDNPAVFLRHDIHFHGLVAELAGNQMMSLVLEMLHAIILEARRRHMEAVGPQEAINDHAVQRTHRYFVELIADGDADAAKALWHKHLEVIEESYLKVPLAESVVEMMA